MSSLLEEAIVDATALKEAALKNAENLIIEKYSQEVKSTMSTLLEQEDPALEEEEEELHKVAKRLPDAFSSTEDDSIIIDLDELDSHINEALSLHEDKKIITGDIDVSAQYTEEDLMREISSLFAEEEDVVVPAADSEELPVPTASAPAQQTDSVDAPADISPTTTKDIGGTGIQDTDIPPEKKPLDDTSDEEVAQILMKLAGMEQGGMAESVKINARPVKSGWEDTPQSQLEDYEDMALALLHDTEIAEDLEKIAKLKKKLQKENKLLKDNAKEVLEENRKLRDIANTLHEKLEEVNISNAKLLYINQTLESVSLNERQKKQIVEAIIRADSVKEAKVIFETLRNSVGSIRKERMPESLSESVTHRSSLLLAARQNNRKIETQSPFFERMQKLAGLKTNN